MMDIQIEKQSYAQIKPLRTLFLSEHQIQIRYDSCHYRGWADSYVFFSAGKALGYGSIKGLNDLSERDCVFEFYLLPHVRKKAANYFQKLLETSQAKWIECQTNLPLQAAMMYQFGKSIYSEVMLFEDHIQSQINRPELIFRKRQPGDEVFGKKESDMGAYVLIKDETIVADGGFLTHYNPPFADLYMETHPDFRNQGLASFILQEIKKECYLEGYRPAARCNISNPASRGALLNAGFRQCGFMLTGRLANVE